MKFYHLIRIRISGLPCALQNEIRAIRPEALEREEFVFECKPGDAACATVAERFVSLCEAHGLRRTTGTQSGEYDYEIVRHYEPLDLEEVPFLLLESQKQMFRGDFRRNQRGRLLLPAAQAKRPMKLATLFLTRWIVASDSVRAALERGNFIGLEFRETVLEGTTVYADTRFWEMYSNLTLPKMKNSVLIKQSVVPCYAIDELPYRYGEPHYSQEEIQSLGDFDIAKTFENLTGQQALVVSQRFYQHCVKNTIPLEVRPVRVEPS